MTAYYNEIDPYAAQWLRNLIAGGHIAPGYVDERSIEDVRPSDLAGFTQCHFFAGIGAWSHALRRAGWPDDRPVWTGSCPCQPFSAAGAGAGFDDERHLWPAFFHLIEQCKPATVIGEQVASKDANPWIDLVQTDLEALGYGVGSVAFPAASVGAPHIRDRLYWVADNQGERRHGRQNSTGARRRVSAETSRIVSRLADASSARPQGGQSPRQRAGPQQPTIERNSAASGMADNCGQRWERRQGLPQRLVNGGANAGWIESDHGFIGGREIGIQRSVDAGPTNGLWSAADWLLCRDGKWRPVEPGTFPLAHGTPARVGRLRAYGNAIVAPQAEIFIATVTEALGDC